LLTGETTPSIAKRLIGNLQFGEEAKTVRQLVAAGGQATAVADNQVMALVRTSINQVANSASSRYMKPTKTSPRNTVTSQH
jgi:hypothetical protein